MIFSRGGPVTGKTSICVRSLPALESSSPAQRARHPPRLCGGRRTQRPVDERPNSGLGLETPARHRAGQTENANRIEARTLAEFPRQERGEGSRLYERRPNCRVKVGEGTDPSRSTIAAEHP